MEQKIIHKIKIRRGTATEWLVINPILSEGEPGYEVDTKKLKFGDGLTKWSNLEYFSYDNGGLAGHILDGGFA